jgi:hypothetical protein
MTVSTRVFWSRFRARDVVDLQMDALLCAKLHCTIKCCAITRTIARTKTRPKNASRDGPLYDRIISYGRCPLAVRRALVQRLSAPLPRRKVHFTWMHCRGLEPTATPKDHGIYACVSLRQNKRGSYSFKASSALNSGPPMYMCVIYQLGCVRSNTVS